MNRTWHSPEAVSQRVAERRGTHEAGHSRNSVARWRIEVGPAFWHHLRKHRLHEIPGWVQHPDGDLLLWDIPIVRVDGPEGWRLLERP